MAGHPSHEKVLRLALGNGLHESFSDCELCPDMVLIPAGRFVMGGKATENEPQQDISPSHAVTLKRAFAVSKYEISVADWRLCVREHGCREPGILELMSGPEMPVTRLSWNDAKAYTAWLSAKTGRPYRLLTEAEWEFLSRSSPAGQALASDRDRERESRSGPWDRLSFFPPPVFATSPPLSPSKRGRPDAYGVYNLRGNSMTWLEDCWHPDYNHAPTDGSAWTTSGVSDCSKRVVRGGGLGAGWGKNGALARAGQPASSGLPQLGFRIAREIQTPNQVARQ
jgi:formylglycine-generating enzyme required for sulfatase activity